jgi:tetratricopeptide (TPR) repeat protein
MKTRAKQQPNRSADAIAPNLVRGFNPTGKVPAISTALFALTVCTFLPVLHNGFVNFDDPLFIYKNPHVQTLSGNNISWAFTTLTGGFWSPLTWLSIMLDRQFFGLNPAGHHMTNVLLHAASAVFLFLALNRMTRAPWRSALVAALFAVHPLHVESVAWATERKDVLSGLFWMLSLWTYARYAETRSSDTSTRRKAWYYPLSLLFFLCGLMSKAIVVTLPLILLLLDYWPLRCLNSNAQKGKLKAWLPLLREKIPFFIASTASGIVTLYAQKTAGALPASAQLPVVSRLANACLSYFRYLLQMFWPADLAVYYPLPAAFPIWPVLGTALLLIVLTAVFALNAHHRPWLAFGWIWYLVTLLPVIGLIQAGGQSHADRYTYLPLIGIFLLLTRAAADLTQSWPNRKPLLIAVSTLICLLCVAFTGRQIGVWKDSETLFRHALAVTSDNELAHNNLAAALLKTGQVDEALDHLREAVKLVPDFADAHNNLGSALIQKGKLEEAIAELETAIRLKPDFADAHNNLGAALGRKGDLPGALVHLQEALRLSPSDLDAHCNAADAFMLMGRFPEAVTHYQQATQLNPESAELHHSLGSALAAAGRVNEAINEFRQAILLKPNYSEAHAHLGIALGLAGHADEAIHHFEEALRVNPENPEAHASLGVALLQKGDLDAAISQLETAVRLRPDYADARRNLQLAVQAKTGSGIMRDNPRNR